MEMETIHPGEKNGLVRSLQRAINRRLKARSAATRVIKVDGEFGPRTRAALIYTAYLLGYDNDKLDGLRTGTITVAEQRFVRNPGLRNSDELARGKRRVAAHRAVVRKRREELEKANAKRKRIIAEAKKAAVNYRKNPGAYHYLAGGTANTVYLKPTPRQWRSDCSQFAASVFKGAGLPSPASVSHEWASTFTMIKAKGVKVVSRANRKPGMLAMYGTREAPHHVEIYCGEPGATFIGHGSPPIDSLTPGEPDYYLDFPFLN